MYENLLANVPTDLWIGGQWRKASDGKRFDVIDPATESTVASVASATVDDAKDWPKLIWILDAREEAHPVPIATCPMPPVDAFASRGGRFGAHNIFENTPSPNAWYSDQIILGTFFNGGLRAYDIANPFQPKEVAAFVPPGPPLARPLRKQSTRDWITELGRLR